MAILRIISAILMAAALTGCYQEFNPTTDIKPVLCINSLVTAGQPVKVEVTHTWVYNDAPAKNNHSVDDAEVAVYANGVLQAEDYVAAEGDEIRILASSASYGKAEATVIVPHAIPFDMAEITPTVNYLHKSDSTDNYFSIYISFDLNMALKISDRPTTDDYFRIRYYSYLSLPDSDEIMTDPDNPDDHEFYWTEYNYGIADYEVEPIFREHIGVFETVMGNDSGDNMFFSDRQFAGKDYTVTLRFTDCSYYVRWPKDAMDHSEFRDVLFDCGLTINLATMSRSYYDELIYAEAVDYGVIGDLGNLGFAEPVWGYSNVSTGAGVVAACSYATYTVNLRDFLEQAFNKH
ncbi:MAG: DUF4249 domain-containing protein [Bacteroidales bacterium]|nr:DUF4249 domain-containing protein [Bacteroidales bacterium]